MMTRKMKNGRHDATKAQESDSGMVTIMLDDVTPPPAVVDNGLVAYEKETASIDSELRAIEMSVTSIPPQLHRQSSLELTDVYARLRVLRGRLVRLGQENRTLSAEIVTSSGVPPASLRMRQAHHRHLITELSRVTAMAEQAGQQALVNARHEDRSITADIVQDAVDNRTSSKGDAEADAIVMLERTVDIRALTKGVEELHHLFVELAAVVDDQQDLLNVVEADIDQAQKFHKKTADEIVVTHTNKKRRQRMKWTCISFLIITILIALIVLIIFLRR